MRKDELERQEREGRRMRRQLAVATAEHVSTTLEICPRFVVPDTNCFIDHLADLRQIALFACKCAAASELSGPRRPPHDEDALNHERSDEVAVLFSKFRD